MSFFASMFGGAPAQAQAPAQNQQPVNQEQQNQQQNQPAAQNSPLDSFSDLWNNANQDGSQTPDGAPGSMFNVDPKALNETVTKMNFLGAIPPKVQEALKAGGEDATKANLYLMNMVAQQSFAQSAQATAKIVEAALAKQAQDFESRVSDVVKKNTVREDLSSANPVFKHAAAAPILQSLEAQMIKKYPNASPTEVSKMAQDFLTHFASEISGSNKPKETGKSNGTDFSSFL